MSFGEIFSKNSGTGAVLRIALVAAISVVVYAVFHYRSLNRSEDPAVSVARKLMADYEKLGSRFDVSGKFSLLDSADAIYRRLPGYRESYERAVVLNNRCSALLFSALYDSTLSPGIKSEYLNLSLVYADSAIGWYKKWDSDWRNRERADIENFVRSTTDKDNRVYDGYNTDRVVTRRTDNISEALKVVNRRLSVAYSNRGIVFRHKMEPDSAIASFGKAIDLWDKNRIAQSNLSVMLGGDPVTPGLIESLFPPKR